MVNTRLPFCPHCTIVVAAAAYQEDPICINCDRIFNSVTNEDGTFTTSKVEQI